MTRFSALAQFNFDHFDLWLSRRFGKITGVPVTHVDSIQFLTGMQVRPYQESIVIIEKIQNQKAWIIDGYGPLDILEKRLALADMIIFIDFPIWKHYWWCTKRQIIGIWRLRQELPPGCSENSWSQTLKLFKTIWKVHRQMRPEMIRILNREKLARKVIWVRTQSEWNGLFKRGVGSE